MEQGRFYGYQRIQTSTSAAPDFELHHAPHPPFEDSSDRNGACQVREQDRFMPIANVIRIMRKVLPAHAKISDDAKETIQECVSEYISFITSEANDRCQREQRKTITAEDVLWAMSKLGFDDYIEPLSIYLQRYRELEGDHRGSIRGEPLPKRVGPEVGPWAATAAFGHPYPMGHPQPGMFAGPMPGYFRDGSGSTSAQAPINGFDPYSGKSRPDSRVETSTNIETPWSPS